MNSHHFQIEYHDKPDTHFMDVMVKGLVKVSVQARGEWKGNFETFAFSVKDPSNKMIAGIEGSTLYGCLHISNIWIDESYRNQGLGSQLLAKAEALGQSRGCTFATLDTFDFFDVIPFYQKHGYEVIWTLTGYEKNTKQFKLRKTLTDS